MPSGFGVSPPVPDAGLPPWDVTAGRNGSADTMLGARPPPSASAIITAPAAAALPSETTPSLRFHRDSRAGGAVAIAAAASSSSCLAAATPIGTTAAAASADRAARDAAGLGCRRWPRRWSSVTLGRAGSDPPAASISRSVAGSFFTRSIHSGRSVAPSPLSPAASATVAVRVVATSEGSTRTAPAIGITAAGQITTSRASGTISVTTSTASTPIMSSSTTMSGPSSVRTRAS